jgi:hypothetical protein
MQANVIALNATDSYTSCLEDIDFNLVFFSIFEDVFLLTTGTMESNGLKLNGFSPKIAVEPRLSLPFLLAGAACWKTSLGSVGRVPLFQCFLCS